MLKYLQIRTGTDTVSPVFSLLTKDTVLLSYFPFWARRSCVLLVYTSRQALCGNGLSSYSRIDY